MLSLLTYYCGFSSPVWTWLDNISRCSSDRYREEWWQLSQWQSATWASTSHEVFRAEWLFGTLVNQTRFSMNLTDPVFFPISAEIPLHGSVFSNCSLFSHTNCVRLWTHCRVPSWLWVCDCWPSWPATGGGVVIAKQLPASVWRHDSSREAFLQASVWSVRSSMTNAYFRVSTLTQWHRMCVFSHSSGKLDILSSHSCNTSISFFVHFCCGR